MAALTELEQHVLERFVQLLEAEYGPDLRSLRLFGSRARGEEPRPESGVDRGLSEDDGPAARIRSTRTPQARCS
jgi:predicted nucleotidyltransferase